MNVKMKRLSDSYIYGIGEYEKNLFKFFMQSEIMDKTDKSFDDIRYEVKRGQQSVLLKTFDSDNVVFLYNTTPLPRALKVFAAQDIKTGDKKMRVFVDMSDAVVKKDGNYVLRPGSLDRVLSYLTSALAHLIYYADPSRIVNNSSLTEHGTEAFAKLFSHIIDLLRIGAVDKLREKCLYLGSVYYQVNILCKDFSDSVENRAKKISRLNSRDIEMIEVYLDTDTFKDINSFIQSVSKVIKADGLKVDNFIEKWMTTYGPGTQFAVELFPSFSTLLTNAYNGAYLNNQKQIEKITGQSMVNYSVSLLRLGSDLA